jgi:hypothetical protein
MTIYSDKSKENQESRKSIPIKTSVQKKSEQPASNIVDNRPDNIVRKDFQKKLKADSSNISIQKKENRTGLPDHLKSGIENLSGHSMNDVKVYYNSDKPAQLNAHAYAQGTDIHLASGQEKYLPHEAWHVVQQKQGRVKPTMQMKGKVNVNDDAGLEKEADVMGAKALQMKNVFKNDNSNQEFNLDMSDTDSSSVEYDSHFDKLNIQPTSYSTKNITQLTAETDAKDAMTNQNHLKVETFPGLAISLGNVIGHIQEKIADYANANLANQDPDETHELSQSADGLKILTQNITEQSDAKWAEAGVMERVINDHAGSIPIPARNNHFDPDIEFSDAINGRARIGYEVKAVNAVAVSSVTAHINEADTQLGNRNASRAGLGGADAALRPALAQSKIDIWIAHEDNHWPGVLGFARRVSDAQIMADVNRQLNSMGLAHATSVKIEMLRIPTVPPSLIKAVDVVATRSHVGAGWNSSIVKRW